MQRFNEYLYDYGNNNDFYCYPNTNILINNFDIRDYEKLVVAERQITALKIAEIEKNKIKGRFDLLHLKKIHKFIFGDIYAWAGNIRDGDFLIKDSTIFCRAMYIEPLAKEIHTKLTNDNFLKNMKKDIFIEKLAYYMGEINALHPFREGNGRTSRIYFRQLANNAGFTLDFHKLSKQTLIGADISAFNKNYKPLIEILDIAISNKVL